MKYKVGDKVKIVKVSEEDESICAEERRGEPAIIDSIVAKSKLPYTLKFKDGGVVDVYEEEIALLVIERN